MLGSVTKKLLFFGIPILAIAGLVLFVLALGRMIRHEMIGVEARRIETWRKEADQKTQSGDWAGAAREYQQIVRLRPNDVQAWRSLASANSCLNNASAYIEALRQVERLQPKNVDIHRELSNAYQYIASPDLNSAEQEMRVVLQISQSAWQDHVSDANLLLRMNCVKEAITEFNKALRINSTSPTTCYSLGMALVQNGQKAQARAEFLKALRLAPPQKGASPSLKKYRSGLILKIRAALASIQ